jgi:alpha,alpha-trehalase
MYYQATEDIEFMSYYGAEMIWEIARFWSSIAKYNEDQQRYEILDVMGPDEFHDSFPGKEGPGLDNNAYTNICAVWVLLEALKLFKILSDERIKELRETIGLDDEELKRWKDITHKMKVCFHDGGIISQFEGYDQLKEFDWEGYNKKYGNIQRLDRILDSEGDSPNNYKLSKQADVLMLFYLFTSEQLECIFDKLGYTFEYETIPKNIDYYLNRTSHGSTLSWIVHSWVLTRSDRKGSWHLFTEALKSDVADIQGGTTPEGIHLGAMAGTVNILQISYTGLRIHDDILWFNPMLPDELACLKMLIRYRGHTLRLSFEKGVLKITAVRVAKRPVKIGLDGEVYELESGKSKEFQYKE